MQVWKILHTVWISEEIAFMRHTVLQYIVPTNERLHAFRLVESDRCRHCGWRDTLAHRQTECNEGTAIWLWTRDGIAQMIRTDPHHIPTDWCLWPHFQFWPSQRHKAILWLLARLVMYRMQQQRRLSLLDYTDVLRRARCKSYRATSRKQQVGNCLSIFWQWPRCWARTQGRSKLLSGWDTVCRGEPPHTSGLKLCKYGCWVRRYGKCTTET